MSARLRGINRPVDLKFGPDDCAYLVDYGAVRDFRAVGPGLKKFKVDADGVLVQIPGTGVIWKICWTRWAESKNGDKEDQDKDD